MMDYIRVKFENELQRIRFPRMHVTIDENSLLTLQLAELFVRKF